MSDTLTIRERIEELLAQILGGLDEVGTVYRTDTREQHYRHMDGYVDAQAEDINDNWPGNPGPLEATLRADLGIYVMQPENEPVYDAYVVNRLLGAITAALKANATLVDGDSQRLAYEPLKITARTPAVLVQAGELMPGVLAQVSIEVVYREDGDDPTTFGSAITAKTVQAPPAEAVPPDLGV